MQKEITYRMHTDKLSCQYIIQSQLGKFLKYVKDNTELFNKYIKYFYDSTENPYDTEGSLTSQCWQTTRTTKYLLSNTDMHSFDIELEGLYKFKMIDNDLTMNGKKIDYNTIIECIDNVFNTPERTNVCIYVSGNSDDNDITIFPGHVFNIILDEAPNKNNINIRPIFVVQSFIYKYTMKIWATNDLTDIKELLLKYIKIFLNDSDIYTLEDEMVAKQLFGIPEFTDYSGKRLVGRTKYRNFTIEKPTHFDFSTIENKINNLIELCDIHINYYKNTLNTYLSLIKVKGYDYTKYNENEQKIIHNIISIVYNDSKFFFIQDCKSECKVLNVYNQQFNNIIKVND